MTGSVNLTLSDGGSFAGNFDVVACQGLTADVCQALSSCTGPVTCKH